MRAQFYLIEILNNYVTTCMQNKNLSSAQLNQPKNGEPTFEVELFLSFLFPDGAVGIVNAEDLRSGHQLVLAPVLHRVSSQPAR